jgi:hypothetical protein
MDEIENNVAAGLAAFSREHISWRGNIFIAARNSNGD